MTTAAMPKPPVRPSLPAPGQGRPAPARPFWTPEGIVAASLLALAYFALYFRWFYTQHLISSTYLADWGHAYAVPLISGYLVWNRREELRAVRFRTFWPGLAPLLLGIGSYVFFVTNRFKGGHMVQGWAALLSLGSLLLLMLGPRAFRIFFLPTMFLVVGVQVSQKVMNDLTAPLQVIASNGAYLVLNVLGAIFGFTVDVNGTVLTLVSSAGRTIPLNVAEACAGMRMVIAFIALAGATALLGCREWWQRIALMLLAVPVAIVVNIGRVAVLGLLSLADQDLSTGNAHTLIGELLLIPGLGLFLLVVWTLNRLMKEPRGMPA
jgi:exosortase